MRTQESDFRKPAPISVRQGDSALQRLQGSDAARISMQWKFCHNQRKCFVNYIAVTTRVWPIPGFRCIGRCWQRWRQRTCHSTVSSHQKWLKKNIQRFCESRIYTRVWTHMDQTQPLKWLNAVMIYSHTLRKGDCHRVPSHLSYLKIYNSHAKATKTTL